MFWNKKDTQARKAIEHLRNYLSFKSTNWDNPFNSFEEEKQLNYKINKKNEDLQTQINLILKELNLTYVPETETKEPAKLVKRDNFIAPSAWGVAGGVSNCSSSIFPPLKAPLVKKQKKAGRPKKK